MGILLLCRELSLDRRFAVAGPGATAADTRRQLIPFFAVAFGLPWLFWLMHQGTGINVVAPVSMAAVGLATLIAVRLRSRGRGSLTATGVLPVRPLRRLLGQSAYGLALVLGLAIAALLISALAGTLMLDPAGLSGLRAVIGAGNDPPGAVLATALVRSLVFFVILLPLAFCEEWGWRGFLLPRLLPLGTWPALLLTGLIWGIWHLPAYLGAGARSGFLPFLISAIVFGMILGHLRLRTGSIWPATVAHAAHNALVTGFVNIALVDADSVTVHDPWSHGLGGWPGWVLAAALVGWLALTGRFGAGTRSKPTEGSGGPIVRQRRA